MYDHNQLLAYDYVPRNNLHNRDWLFNFTQPIDSLSYITWETAKHNTT